MNLAITVNHDEAHEIQIDANGMANATELYAIYRDARGDEKNQKRPALYLRTTMAKRKIEHLKSIGKENVVQSTQGKSGSTWMCESLMYSYAMWLSAEFEHKVIEAYKALAKGDITGALEIAGTKAALDILEQLKEHNFTCIPRNISKRDLGRYISECAENPTKRKGYLAKEQERVDAIIIKDTHGMMPYDPKATAKKIHRKNELFDYDEAQIEDRIHFLRSKRKLKEWSKYS